MSYARFRAKWMPVRVKKTRQKNEPGAFSSEVVADSREENASEKISHARSSGRGALSRLV